MQSQVRFNRVPEKVPERLWCRRRFRRRFWRKSRRLWCRARSSSTGPCTTASQTFSGTFYPVGSAPKLPRNLLRNLRPNPVERGLALRQSLPTFGTFSATSLNLTWRLHQFTPELFWAEDPISLRCWGKM